MGQASKDIRDDDDADDDDLAMLGRDIHVIYTPTNYQQHVNPESM